MTRRTSQEHGQGTPMPAPSAPPAAPANLASFTSSSGKTVLQYYRWVSSAGMPSFRGIITVPTGFDRADVALSGFSLATDATVDQVLRLAARVQAFRYDPQSGDLEVGVSGQLTTGGQGWSSDVTFVVILTKTGVARITPISTGCTGTAQCDALRFEPGSVPTGMSYIGLATQNWDLGSDSGAIPLNAGSGHHDGISVTGGTFWVRYLSALTDGTWANRMFSEWGAIVLAFDPSEMTPVQTTLPLQYTFLGRGQTARHVTHDHPPAPVGKRVTGFLDAFEGLTLMYRQTIGGPQYPIWMVEASAAVPTIGPTGVTTQYGLFLGTIFGNTAATQPFEFQLSRCAGFLH